LRFVAAALIAFAGISTASPQPRFAENAAILAVTFGRAHPSLLRLRNPEDLLAAAAPKVQAPPKVLDA
jgi:hypothetical protein